VDRCTASRTTGWFATLGANDQQYVRDVVAAMRDNPSAAPYVVADKLRDELQLDRHVSSIARTLKEMCKNG